MRKACTVLIKTEKKHYEGRRYNSMHYGTKGLWAAMSSPIIKDFNANILGLYNY